MKFNIKSTETLMKDIDKKYLSSGLRLSGEIKGEKISLYLEDDHGKRSQFATRTFYGKINDNVIIGNFRISNYALILLIILFVFAVENLITSIIFSGLSGVIISSAVIIAEIIYFFAVKKLSYTHDETIINYLNSI